MHNVSFLGVGGPSKAAVDGLIDRLNKGFSGGQESGAPDTGFRFTLAGYDNVWYTPLTWLGVDPWLGLHASRRGSHDDLNIWVTTIATLFTGTTSYSSFP